MRKIALILSALFCIGQAHAQQTQTGLDAEINQLLPSNNRNEITGANLRQVLTDMVSATYGLGGWTNTTNPQSAAYTVEPTDNWTTLALGGDAFYTLTFNSPSTYTANFGVMVLNEDSGRAKWISLSGGPSFYLWPGQSVIVFSQNGAWQTIGRSRWKTPAGALTINTDPVNGSEAPGATDGLATGSGAFKSINNALSTLLDQFDLNGTTNPTIVTVLMAAGATDTEQVHFSPHSLVGAQGGAAVIIDGGGGTLNVSTGSAMQLYFGAVIRMRNITITSSGGNDIDLLWGSKLYVEDLVTFGATASSGNAALNVQNGGDVEFDDSFTISGGGGYFLAASAGQAVAANAITATVSANISFISTVFEAAGAYVNLSNVTWSLGGHTVTASQGAYNISQASTLLGASNVPGSVAGISQFAVGEIVTPYAIGGTAANSVLQLISSSNGSPSGDEIQALTGGLVRLTIASNGAISAPAIGSAAQTNALCFNSSTGAITYQAWSTGCASSSARFKEGIASLESRGNSLLTVLHLAPVLFRYRADTGLGADEHYGFIAERVAGVAPHLVTYDGDGRPYAVKYQEMAPLLVGAIQQLALLLLLVALAGGAGVFFLAWRR